MPVYNAERYVAQAVQSILDQTFTDFEFIIIDDGSTDRSLEILKRFEVSDPRIRLISRPNTGLVVALNEMLQLAQGEFIARMDADDISLPGRFQFQVDCLSSKLELVLIGSRVIIIDPDGDELCEIRNPLTHDEIDQGFMNREGQLVFHPSVMFRRSIALELGGYSGEYRHVEDLDFFLRLAERGKIENSSIVTLKYREHFEKIGRKYCAEQERNIDRVLSAARERRGCNTSVISIAQSGRTHMSKADIYQTWGWWAIKSGNIATARKYAWRLFRTRPFNVSTWRLVFCIIRGH